MICEYLRNLCKGNCSLIFCQYHCCHVVEFLKTRQYLLGIAAHDTYLSKMKEKLCALSTSFSTVVASSVNRPFSEVTAKRKPQKRTKRTETH